MLIARRKTGKIEIILMCPCAKRLRSARSKKTICVFRIGRFSKSIKIEKQVCGRCHGKLELVNSNYVNNQSVGNIENLPSETGKDHLRGVVPLPQTPRTPNQYALFVKEKWSSVKKPGNSF